MTETPRPERRLRKTAWLLLLVAILLLAAGLRFYRIDDQSLWYDEGNSAFAASQPLSRIVEGAARDIHPPGYYILLAGWRSLAGESELALRLLSALLGVLTVALVAAIGARLFERTVGVLAALLVAVSPFQVWYGQEARMYALLALLSAASIMLTALVLSIPAEMAAGRFRTGRAAAILGGYVLVNAAGLYTHYTFPFILLVESLVFLLWLARRPRKLHSLLTWAGLQIAALILYAPWLPAAFRQVTTWPRVPSPPVGLTQIGGTVAYGLTVPPAEVQSGLIPLLLLAAVGLFPPLGGGGGQRVLRFEERLGLVAGWLLLPIAIPVALDIVREPYLKFFLPAGLALALLVARGIVMGYRISVPVPGANAAGALLTRIVVAILLAVGSLPLFSGLQNLYTNPDYARDNYREIARRIRAEAGPEAAVVLVAPNQFEVFTYYYPDGPGIAPLPDDRTGETLARLLHEYDRIYAVYWGEVEQDPDRNVEQALNASAFAADSTWYGSVRLVTYVVPAPAASAPQVPGSARFGEAIGLEGYALSARTLRPGEALAVTLFWQTESVLSERYKVFVHLYGPDGTIAAQHDSEPGGDLRPTTTWQPGETVIDNHGLLLPADASPGQYRLMIGLYGFDDNRLPVWQDGEPGGDRLLLDTITVTPAGEE